MVSIDRFHLFNVAADGLFLILIAFSSRKVLKKRIFRSLLTLGPLPRPNFRKLALRWSFSRRLAGQRNKISDPVNYRENVLLPGSQWSWNR